MADQNNTPTYILLAFYVLAMVIVTIVANRQNAAQAAASNENHIKNHFLASKQFGVVVLFLTTFASIFSGYTVAGVPNEAGDNGYSAIRWIGSTGMVSVSFLMLFPRLRRISMAREYISPGDFIFDRYRSKFMSKLNTFLLCIPQLLYVTVQLHALGATVDFFTQGELPFNAVVIVAAALMLIFEALGGLRTVAYTDVVQAGVMVIIFLTLPIILAAMYHGGLTGMVINSDKLPCANHYTFESEVDIVINNVTYSNGTEVVDVGCLNYVSGPDGIDEYYLRSPSKITIANYLLFSVSLMSFGLNPHVMQRVMAAQNDGQVRLVMIAMSLTPYMCQLPGVFTGIAYLANKASFAFPLNLYPAFWSTLGVLQSEGGFREFVAYVAMLGAVAGIMSTADSALIGVSNTFVVDIFKNWLTPDLSPTKIVWIGKAVSFTMVALSVGIAINMEATSERTGEDVNYGALLGLQQAILWQAFPAYMLGMYTNVSWRSILSGICVGLIVNLALLGLIFSNDQVMEGVDGSWAVLSSVCCNLLVIAIVHVIKGGDDEGDEDEEVKVVDPNGTYHDLKMLKIGSIRKIMSGIDEPLTKYKGVFVYGVAFFVLIAAVFWFGKIDPALIDEFGEDAVALMGYNGYVRSVVGGMPVWAFLSMWCFAFATMSGLYATWSWNTDAVKDDDQESVEATSPMSAESPDEAGSVEMGGRTDSKDIEDEVLTTTDV